MVPECSENEFNSELKNCILETYFLTLTTEITRTTRERIIIFI